MVVSFCYFVLSCCVFLASHQVVSCITCYSCASCSVTSNGWGSISSSANGAQCSKYVYVYLSVSYTDRSVSTTCTPGPNGLGGTTYCCSTDKCNEGVTLSSSFILIFTLITVISIINIHQ